MRHYRIQRPSTVKVKDQARCRQKKKKAVVVQVSRRNYTPVNWAIDYSLGLFFEVGLSESYSDLVSDAHQWLLRSSGIIGTL